MLWKSKLRKLKSFCPQNVVIYGKLKIISCVAVRWFSNEEYSLVVFQEVGCVWFNAVLVDLISRYCGEEGEGRQPGESLAYLLRQAAQE